MLRGWSLLLRESRAWQSRASRRGYGCIAGDHGRAGAWGEEEMTLQDKQRKLGKDSCLWSGLYEYLKTEAFHCVKKA